MICSTAGTPIFQIVPASRAYPREVGTICLGLFSGFTAFFFGPIWGHSMTFSPSGFGVLEPRIHHLSLSGPIWAFFKLPKHDVFKGKMANFEAKNTLKQGGKCRKDKSYPFHACTLPPPRCTISAAHPFCCSRFASFVRK